MLKDDEGQVSGAFCYERESGRFFCPGGAERRPRHRRHQQKSFKVTSNSWEYTGDGHALALLAGARC
ncbi:hypothetical protein [Streptomyces sp. KL116D]|uniref:hypothetical protein n=1 Tax=Streptomyces sp. KL116D TaxID=3045152 RepID=UPI003557F217